MRDKLPPLNYAIIKLFADGRKRCAKDVVVELAYNYRGYKLLSEKDVEEALLTAKENSLLDESAACRDDSDNELRIYFKLNDYGREMVKRYL